MITVSITLTTAGVDTGPTFNLYSNVDGYVTAFETSVPKASLVAGYISTLVPDGTTIVRVYSPGTCNTYVDLNVITTTTSTTSTTSTTTTNTPTTTTTTTVLFYSFLLNSTAGEITGPDACADYLSFNRQTYYASPSNGPTIHTGTFLYTNSSLTTPIPDGFRSDGTTYWNFQSGNTGDNGTPCSTITTTTTTTTPAPHFKYYFQVRNQTDTVYGNGTFYLNPTGGSVSFTTDYSLDLINQTTFNPSGSSIVATAGFVIDRISKFDYNGTTVLYNLVLGTPNYTFGTGPFTMNSTGTSPGQFQTIKVFTRPA